MSRKERGPVCAVFFASKIPDAVGPVTGIFGAAEIKKKRKARLAGEDVAAERPGNFLANEGFYLLNDTAQT